jgi:hypothetical protein
MRSKCSRRSCWHHIHRGTIGEGHVAPRIDIEPIIKELSQSRERIKEKKGITDGQHRHQSDPHGAAASATATSGERPVR